MYHNGAEHIVALLKGTSFEGTSSFRTREVPMLQLQECFNILHTAVMPTDESSWEHSGTGAQETSRRGHNLAGTIRVHA